MRKLYPQKTNMCEEVRGLLILRKISGDAFTQVKLLVACQKDRLKLYFYRPKKMYLVFADILLFLSKQATMFLKLFYVFLDFMAKLCIKKLYEI